MTTTKTPLAYTQQALAWLHGAAWAPVYKTLYYLSYTAEPTAAKSIWAAANAKYAKGISIQTDDGRTNVVFDEKYHTVKTKLPCGRMHVILLQKNADLIIRSANTKSVEDQLLSMVHVRGIPIPPEEKENLWKLLIEKKHLERQRLWGDVKDAYLLDPVIDFDNLFKDHMRDFQIHLEKQEPVVVKEEPDERKPETIPFELGRKVLTPGALELLPDLSDRLRLLKRHQNGDWGEVGTEDAEANRQALFYGDRLMSVYKIKGWQDMPDETVWIITEADRSATTIMLPSEY